LFGAHAALLIAIHNFQSKQSLNKLQQGPELIYDLSFVPCVKPKFFGGEHFKELHVKGKTAQCF